MRRVKNKSDVYKIQAIRGRKILKGKLYYLIKWKSIGEKNNSWEPIEKISDLEFLNKKFKEYNSRANKAFVKRYTLWEENQGLVNDGFICSDKESEEVPTILMTNSEEPIIMEGRNRKQKKKMMEMKEMGSNETNKIKKIKKTKKIKKKKRKNKKKVLLLEDLNFDINSSTEIHRKKLKKQKKKKIKKTVPKLDLSKYELDLDEDDINSETYKIIKDNDGSSSNEDVSNQRSLENIFNFSQDEVQHQMGNQRSANMSLVCEQYPDLGNLKFNKTKKVQILEKTIFDSDSCDDLVNERTKPLPKPKEKLNLQFLSRNKPCLHRESDEEENKIELLSESSKHNFSENSVSSIRNDKTEIHQKFFQKNLSKTSSFVYTSMNNSPKKQIESKPTQTDYKRKKRRNQEVIEDKFILGEEGNICTLSEESEIQQQKEFSFNVGRKLKIQECFDEYTNNSFEDFFNQKVPKKIYNEAQSKNEYQQNKTIPNQNFKYSAKRSKKPVQLFLTSSHDSEYMEYN
jgi:hypothetical protein